jgi:hypothetical protein
VSERTPKQHALYSLSSLTITFLLVGLLAIITALSDCQLYASKNTKEAAANQPAYFKAGDLDVVVAGPLPPVNAKIRLLKMREESIIPVWRLRCLASTKR